MSRVLATSLGRVKCRGFSLCSAVRLLPVFWRRMCTLGPWAVALFSGFTASPGIRLQLCRGWSSLLCGWGLRFAVAPSPPCFLVHVWPPVLGLLGYCGQPLPGCSPAPQHANRLPPAIASAAGVLSGSLWCVLKRGPYPSRPVP